MACVGGGEQALNAFKLREFDMVLIDLIMPDMDGFEATRRIKQLVDDRQRWVPIIVITGLNDEETVLKGLAAGADDFIYKPFHADILHAKLESFAKAIGAYRKLIDSEARANAISEGVLDAVLSIDEAGTVLSVNRATETLFGYRREELLGQNISMLMPEAYRGLHEHALRDYLLTGIKKIIGQAGREVEGLKKSGEIVPLRIGVSEVRLDNARIFIGVLSDISDLKNKEAELLNNSKKLQMLHQKISADMEMANQIMDRLIQKAGLDEDPLIRYHLKPSVQFSGDLIVAARSPHRQLYVMLADASGHGLPAAVSVLPALWVFYGMVVKEFTLPEIAAEMNSRLKKTVPVGRFVAAHLAAINMPAQTLRLWSGGMPSAWLIDGRDGCVREFPSRHPSLGILSSQEFDAGCEVIEWQNDSHLLLFSDGLCEAQTADGAMLGEEKVQAVINSRPGEALLDKLRTLLDTHLRDEAAIDDISIADILLRR